METRLETIIVGGGCAGMLAAVKLREAGRPYLLITERMGGRVLYRKDLRMNFGAVFFGGDLYRHVRQLVTLGPKVLPSYRAVCCHTDENTQFSALSLRTAIRIGQVIKVYRYMRKEFMPRYAIFKADCETMQMKDALGKSPFMEELVHKPADRFIADMGIRRIADDLISPFVHACTGSLIKTLSAFDYAYCMQALMVDLKYFEFDEEAMTARLRGDGGDVRFDTVTAVRRSAEDAYAVETASGGIYRARNVVLATPADVTAEIVKPVVTIPRIRNATPLRAYLVRGEIKERYRKYVVNIFADTIPIIFTRKRSEGEWSVFTEREIDLGKYFDRYEIVASKHWPKALFTNPNIVLAQDLAENLYMAGDHNGLGMEPAAVSGIYAANRIINA